MAELNRRVFCLSAGAAAAVLVTAPALEPMVMFDTNPVTCADIPPQLVEIEDGWLLCNGAEIPAGKYPQLFATIGEAWMEGDTIKLPDYRGRVAPKAVHVGPIFEPHLNMVHAIKAAESKRLPGPSWPIGTIVEWFRSAA